MNVGKEHGGGMGESVLLLLFTNSKDTKCHLHYLFLWGNNTKSQRAGHDEGHLNQDFCSGARTD